MASLLVALCGLVDPGAQAAAAATVVVFSVDALKGALIMLLEDCVSGAVAGLQFLSSWSVVETPMTRAAPGLLEVASLWVLWPCWDAAPVQS